MNKLKAYNIRYILPIAPPQYTFGVWIKMHIL